MDQGLMILFAPFIYTIFLVGRRIWVIKTGSNPVKKTLFLDTAHLGAFNSISISYPLKFMVTIVYWLCTLDCGSGSESSILSGYPSYLKI